MKKITLLILSAVMTLCAFTSCAKEETSSQNAENSTADTTNSYADRIQNPLDKSSPMTGTTDEMQNADFWINNCKNADEVVMSEGEIHALNEQINSAENTACVDLYSYPETLSYDELSSLLNSYSLPTDTRYDSMGNAASYYDLDNNCNKYAVEQTNSVQFGYISTECEMYSFPTTEPSYTMQNDAAFNRFAETTQKVWDKVAILHTSSDGQFLFVQSDSYLGWVEAENICVSGRDMWKTYDEQDFLTVTDKKLVLDNNPFNSYTSEMKLTMGTTLPLVADKPQLCDSVGTYSSYVVVLPGRNDDGTFLETQARVPYSSDVCEGYLSYTKANFITQAFKFLGERYAWSNTLGAHDCTGFIKDVYAAFGIRLPRNTDNMDSTPAVHNDVSGMSDDEKLSLLSECNEGAILITDGHAMLYLGTVDGKQYVIQDFSRFIYDGAEYRSMCVAVTDLDIITPSGTTYIGAVNGITQLKK